MCIARIVLAVITFLILSHQEFCVAATPSGTLLSNTASLTFKADNMSLRVVSNTITVQISATASLIVNPKESNANQAANVFVVGQTSTSLFTISNTGNVPDAYMIQGISVSAGAVIGLAFVNTSGATVPATQGQTVSPTVNPGQSEGVQVTISTQGIALGTQVVIALTVQNTATKTAGGLQSDKGTIVGLVAAGVAWGAPPGVAPSGVANTTPIALVNGMRSTQVPFGSSIAYSVGFENYGGVTATNVQLLDNVPVGVVPDINSVTLNGVHVSGVRLTSQVLNSQSYTGPTIASNQVRQPLSGQVLVIPVGSIAPMLAQIVTFTGAIGSGVALGTTFVNNVTLEGSNVPPVVLPPTSVFLGTASVIYDGTIGPSKPIVGAQITLANAATGLPISLSGTATTLNPQNTDPFVTGAGGQYGFGLGTRQYGYGTGSITYVVLISATGYLNRKIQATLTPDASGLYYSVTLNAMDGQSLALAGGYGLTKQAVSISDVYGMLGNFPLFTPNAVTVAKTADRTTASGGDRVIFTVNFSSNGTTTLNKTQIVDTLPPGLVYGPGTGRVDAQPSEPIVHGRVLTWSLPVLSSAHVITYATVVMPTVGPGVTLTNVVTVNAALSFDPNSVASASATCSVQITAGIFSDRGIISGRVFVDTQGTGHFKHGDHGVAAVRIYLEDGESVTTDNFGRFTFQATRPGMHVMRLDITTLPKTVQAYPDRRYDSVRSVRRLVHGIFDSGLMEDVNFALRAAL
jgi:uncharacterized repeat protein (TIGR01451 family)